MNETIKNFIISSNYCIITSSEEDIMANWSSKKIIGWVTRHGVHIPIYDKTNTQQNEPNVKRASYTNVIGEAETLDEENFNKQSAEKNVYYRGGKTNDTTELLKDSSYRPNRHSRGHGLYMTSDKNTAEEHAQGREVIEGFMDNDSKIITEKEAHNLYYKNKGKKPKKADEVTGYISKKGYDAMKVENARFGKEDYLVVFNRNHLKIKKRRK